MFLSVYELSLQNYLITIKNFLLPLILLITFTNNYCGVDNLLFNHNEKKNIHSRMFI